MKKQILFLQGSGDDGYEADKKMVDSLKKALGVGYNVQYPRLQVDESKPDFGWCEQIGQHIEALTGKIILVAHSLGASILLKYLSENNVEKKISAAFLISTPFWSGNEDWKKGLKLHTDFAEKLPEEISFSFYQCRDDEEVPFDQFLLYKQTLPRANFCEITEGGHQLNNNLTVIAGDVKHSAEL